MTGVSRTSLMVGEIRSKALLVLSGEETVPLSNCRYPHLRNLNSTVAANVVTVKSYVNSL